MQHVVVQLQTLDVVKVVEEVLGNALQSIGAQVERVEALLEAAERLLGEKTCIQSINIACCQRKTSTRLRELITKLRNNVGLDHGQSF